MFKPSELISTLASRHLPVRPHPRQQADGRRPTTTSRECGSSCNGVLTTALPTSTTVDMSHRVKLLHSQDNVLLSVGGSYGHVTQTTDLSRGIRGSGPTSQLDCVRRSGQGARPLQQLTPTGCAEQLVHIRSPAESTGGYPPNPTIAPLVAENLIRSARFPRLTDETPRNFCLTYHGCATFSCHRRQMPARIRLNRLHASTPFDRSHSKDPRNPDSENPSRE